MPERKPQKTRGGEGKAEIRDTMVLEKRVSDALGLAVTVSHRDPGGTVQVRYRNLEQLDEVMRRLAKEMIGQRPLHVIACDKRKAFAQGSGSDEAIDTSFAARWIAPRSARNDGR